MIYLLLSILCSSTMSIVMRLSEGRVKYKSGMLAANYLACILMSACFIGPSRLFAAARAASRSSPFQACFSSESGSTGGRSLLCR